ncbi:MAG: PEP-CTERM sorting domain-containing protein [Bryobacteraceae bacterium]|nr:PEP-CTERM sorting domain-containing protein [Bryobacteraceae bacterium]
MKKTILLSGFLALFTSSLASAALITAGAPDNSTTTSIVGITGFSTLGDQMGGMQISVTFDGGDIATCTWAATGVGAGGCSGTGASSDNNAFNLNLTGDTFSSNWNFTATGRLATSLTINAILGNTVFDIIATDPANSTPGSAEGLALNGTTPGTPTGSGIYSNVIAVGANSAVGDLYGALTITFSGGVASATFLADTDTVGLPGNGGDVPEPSTYALIAVGAALIAWKRRR